MGDMRFDREKTLLALRLDKLHGEEDDSAMLLDLPGEGAATIILTDRFIGDEAIACEDTFVGIGKTRLLLTLS